MLGLVGVNEAACGKFLTNTCVDAEVAKYAARLKILNIQAE